MVKQRKKKVLFVCTHNSSRSQIGEALLRALYGDRYEAYSAGTKPTRVNPYAIRVMKEIGIDISSQSSKRVDEFLCKKFDYVVTVCNHAKEECPVFPGAKKYLHQDFEDPSECKGTEEEILAIFRRVRNEVMNWVKETFDKVDDTPTSSPSPS